MGLRLDEGTGRGHTHSLFGKKEHQNLHFNINEKNYRPESIVMLRGVQKCIESLYCVCVWGGGISHKVTPVSLPPSPTSGDVPTSLPPAVLGEYI